MSLRTLGQKNSGSSLRIFDRFQVDKNLPKFEEERKKAAEEEAKARKGSQFSSSKGEVGTVIMGESFGDSGDGWFAEPSFGSRLKALFKKGPKEVPVKKVFEVILTEPSILEEYSDRNSTYDTLIANAKRAGQTRLVEQLETARGIRIFENGLYAMNLRKFLTEEQLLRFVMNCKDGLCLDWITHFIRPIPEDVLATKYKCDEAHLFDNYVVLHFDPDNRGTTKKDREVEKDPILFGVVKGSRKLYFIGDWVDELCTLTLEQVAESLGETLEMPEEVGA